MDVKKVDNKDVFSNLTKKIKDIPIVKEYIEVIIWELEKEQTYS